MGHVRKGHRSTQTGHAHGHPPARRQLARFARVCIRFFPRPDDRSELTPDILVAICDSVRPDVQQFGRELITRYFREEDGQTYLLRLSEHPGEALQLFASNYLERYASGRPERIGELEPYFTTVLSRVNKGRIAKQRCIAFLFREALSGEESAYIAARIFARQSATAAIGDSNFTPWTCTICASSCAGTKS